jgi:hypothetical protein
MLAHPHRFESKRETREKVLFSATHSRDESKNGLTGAVHWTKCRVFFLRTREKSNIVRFVRFYCFPFTVRDGGMVI